VLLCDSPSSDYLLTQHQLIGFYSIGSVQHFGTGFLHLVQINHQPEANNFSVYYPDFCLQLNMFRAFFRPSSGAQ
jgi:hypothetical protein